MKVNKSKKIIAILMLIITLISTLQSLVYARSEMSSADVYEVQPSELHLQYWNADKGTWYYVITNYVGYNYNGKMYPAYCLDKDSAGVAEMGGYTVSVSDVLDNVQVWRTIISGFPYRNASDLGVENDLDAYVATKQAVYSILYGRDVRSFYKGGDARGDAIVNAMEMMVNEGRNGTRTPASANVTLNKQGGLREENNYYTQEYSASSIVRLDNYTITATANLPEGSYIADVNGSNRTTFSGSEHFKVYVPKDKMNVDINSVIAVSAKCETYPIFYGNAPASGYQPYALTFDPLGDEVGQGNLNVLTNTGKIVINKTDEDTNNPIEGVTFQLSKKDGTVICNATTNQNGIVTFTKLYQGNYILKEISTNQNYVLNTKEFDVNVEFNKVTTLDITNKYKEGKLKVYKVDKDNNKITLGGVEFNLFSEEFNKVIGTYATNENGEISIENLRIGDYTLQEVKTNKWYNLAEDREVKVEWEQTTNTTIENELKKGQVKVIKVDKDNNEVKLEGVVFEVQDKNGNVLEKIKTDENGEALTSKYPIRDYNEIYLKEIETDEKYKLNDEIIKVQLTEDQISTIKFENELKKGQIKVIKVDKDNHEVKLEGVEFELYDEKNNFITTLVTDKNGEAITDRLPIYKNYVLKETKTQTYYLLNEEEKVITLEENQISNIVFENEAVDIKVNVEKTGFKETQSKDNIFYDFLNIRNDSNVPLNNFTWSDSLPTEAVRADKIYTGIWNEDLTYSVWYKTNKNDYKLLADNLSTQVNNELTFKDLGVEEDEYVTDYEFRFGTVKIGFQEVESPILYCDMLDGLGNGFVFTNNTKVSGNYLERYTEDIDSWTTITYYKDIQLEKLPRTGC